MNPTNMRVTKIPGPFGGPETWAVVEDPEGEINNYGLVAAGFEDEAKARAWMEDLLSERQAEEWEAWTEQDRPQPEIPF